MAVARTEVAVLMSACLTLGLAVSPVVGQGPAEAPARQIVGRLLSMDEAVAIALETQPQIQARLYDYAAARFRVDQAMSPLLPQLSSSVSASRSKSSVLSTAVGSTSVIVNRYFDETLVAQVALSQLLFDFGKNLAATEAAKKLSAVALEDVELQRQLIALAVKEAFTNTLFAQRLIRVQQQAVERAELNLKSARGFFDVGTRPRSDVARAEVDVANARVDLIRARNAERVARVALNTAMGIEIDTPTQVQDNLVYEPVSLDRGQIRAEALRQRPEYRQVKLQVEAAEAIERQAFRNFFPDVTGSGTYGGIREELTEVWSLTLALTWNMYDGGGRVARYREARANVDGARSRVRALELDLLREVEQSQITIEEAQERLQAAQTAVVSAQENFRLAQGRFDAGVGTILELTDAQLALTQTQNVEAQALADYRIALYRLDRARGRR
ncbi:MAG TPA: TolC family protein [Methylomirabilota bacterium]|nr:TolC family protein [Methylomirabilota bacterium]